MKRVDILVYSRPGCHLCEAAHAEITGVLRELALDDARIQLMNVEDDADLESAYGQEIPVVRINDGEPFNYRGDVFSLRTKIERLWNQ